MEELAATVGRIGAAGVRLVGPLFVLLAASLIAFCGWVYFRALLPFWHDEPLLSGVSRSVDNDGGEEKWFWGKNWSLLAWADFLWSVLIVVQLLGSYFSTVLTKPGYALVTGDCDPDDVEGDFERAGGQAAQNKRGRNFTKICRTCRSVKPERAHHCHICGRCVLKMDHHCPWVANCVGHWNHKTFVLFLLYLWISCVWVAVHAFPVFRMKRVPRARAQSVASTSTAVAPLDVAGVVTELSAAATASLWDDSNLGMTRNAATFAFVLTLSVSLALGFMLIWQLYLVATSQTTIEFYHNRWQMSVAQKRGETFRNPYNLGLRRNFADFFGAEFWDWRWPLFFVAPAGDGVNWQRFGKPPHRNATGNDAGGFQERHSELASDPEASVVRQRGAI